MTFQASVPRETCIENREKQNYTAQKIHQENQLGFCTLIRDFTAIFLKFPNFRHTDDKSTMSALFVAIHGLYIINVRGLSALVSARTINRIELPFRYDPLACRAFPIVRPSFPLWEARIVDIFETWAAKENIRRIKKQLLQPSIYLPNAWHPIPACGFYNLYRAWVQTFPNGKKNTLSP